MLICSVMGEKVKEMTVMAAGVLLAAVTKANMKDTVMAVAVLAAYVPIVIGWLMVTDEMIHKVVDAVCDFFFAPTPEPKHHGDLIAIYGEAYDG